MTRRASISLKPDPALHARRVLLDGNKLVYVLVAEKKLTYDPGRRSRIVYVGTTKNGGARVAESVSFRSSKILRLHGVRYFEARIVTCRPRQHVKMWLKLERAFLLEFKSLFGAVPICNSHGKAMKETDEFEYFSRDRVRRVIDDLS